MRYTKHSFKFQDFILKGRGLEELHHVVCTRGSCVDSDWLVSKDDQRVRMCETCPVRRECLDDALAVESNTRLECRGEIWGGMTPEQRVRLYQAWKQGEQQYEQLLVEYLMPPMDELPDFSGRCRDKKELAEVAQRMRIELLPEVPEVPENVFEARLVAAVKAVRAA